MQTEMRKAVYPTKMERLIGILSNLLQREQVTTPETGVICVAIHTFEWAFVRLALFALIAAAVGVFLMWKKA